MYTDLIVVLVILLALTILIYWKESWPWFALLLAFAVLIQPFVYAAGFIRMADRDLVYFDTPLMRFLSSRPDISRVAQVFQHGEDIVPQQLAVRYGIEKVDGYDATRTRSFAEYVNAINNETYIHISVSRIKRFANPKLMDMMNVRYIVTDQNLSLVNPELYKLVFVQRDHPYYDTEGTLNVVPVVYVYQNMAALPRAYMVPNAIVNRSQDILSVLNSIDPTNTVVLDEDPIVPSKNPIGYSTVKILKYTPNVLVLRVDSSNRGFLVVSNAYSPVWTATVNGKATPVLRGNSVFLAIPVPSGSSEVVLYDGSPAFTLGMWISLISWIVVVLVLVLIIRLKYWRTA
jgi:hypothetical protein